MLKAIIFDMDGVLVDSPKHVWSSFQTLLKEYNVEFSKEYIKKNLGKSLQDNFLAWKEEFNIPNIELKEFARKATIKQLELLKEESVDPELIYFLELLKREKIPCAVATSSHRARAEQILNHLNVRTYFQALVGAEDVERHKPNPDVFLEAAKRVNVLPENCVVVEDAKDGIMAAKAGNMKSIGKLTPHNDEESLSQADMIFTTFSELSLEKIKQLF